DAKQGVQPHAEPRERVAASLLAVDDADGDAALEARRAQGPDRLGCRAGRRDDVLDQADALPGCEHALEPVAGRVLLLLLPDDQKREPRGERGRRRESDGAELHARQTIGLGQVLGDGPGDPLAERLEQLGASLEAVLVEVVGRAPTGAEYEVALEVGVLAERAPELRVGHGAYRLEA